MMIDPALSTAGWVSGPEWQMPGTGAGPGSASQSSGTGFGGALTKAIGDLSQTQDQAAQASQALATGQASDPSQVVMEVEQARLAMQLASQIRTNATSAINDLLHTQV